MFFAIVVAFVAKQIVDWRDFAGVVPNGCLGEWLCLMKDGRAVHISSPIILIRVVTAGHLADYNIWTCSCVSSMASRTKRTLVAAAAGL